MRLLVPLLVGALGCAAGGIPDGPRGIVLGQAEISRCTTRGDETVCEKISGGVISPEGSKIVGPISNLIQFIVGFFH